MILVYEKKWELREGISQIPAAFGVLVWMWQDRPNGEGMHHIDNGVGGGTGRPNVWVMDTC